MDALIVNFSRLSGALGRAARLPLRWIPSSTAVPILQGPLRGAKWIVGSATHGCWLGSYELDKQLLVGNLIHRGDVVYDIGANVGYYTLLFSRLVGSEGSVVAFEPLPENLSYLHEHLSRNGVTNTRVVGAAVSDTAGRARFAISSSRSMGQLAPSGELEVVVVKLDELITQGFPEPGCLKIDVEGGEAGVLEGARRLISAFRPIILLATHGEAMDAQCRRILDELGYSVTTIGKATDELLARPV